MRIGASALFFTIDFLDPKHDLFIVALGVLLVLLLLRTNDRERSRRVTVAVAALVVSGYAGIFARGAIEFDANTRVLARNFYGALSVRDFATSWGMYRNLLHGTVLHGEQLLPPLNSRTPTTYYAPKSGVGLAITSLEKRGPIRAGFIGLGAGTMAAYGRPGDYFRFYDINPLVMQIAKSQFTFLSESRARIDIVQGDARLSLERERPENFDLLVVDAFSGDAIPVHLLTREAFALYWRHLKPDGVLAIHTSNTYLQLAPVVLMGAVEKLRDAKLFVYDGKGARRAQPSEWVLVSSAEGFFDQPELKSSASFIDPVLRLRMWTDDYSDLYHILR
jgi:SAM-dependent methyltransferase